MRKRRFFFSGLGLAAVFVALAAGLWFGFAAAPAHAANVTISVPTPFTTADASDGTTDGTFNVTGDLTITGTGSILYDDTTTTCPGPGGGNFSACPITIHVTGNLVMQAGSKIKAENLTTGGNGGDITITVDKNMTMCGPAGAQLGCGGPSGNLGALISSQKLAGAGDTGDAGAITITVGNKATATGDFYMEGGDTTYGAETGAKIDATGTGDSGDITITPGHSYFTEPGSVVQSGGHDASAIQRGGKIYIVTGCVLTSEGRVTSKGPDPGADLVHLEGCDVFVRGLVESTGKGHTVANPANLPNVQPFNSCDGFPDGLPNEIVHTDKPANATGCIEVWGKNITIDASNSWAGELNADIGDGGTQGTSWIDVFAASSLTVTDGPGNDRISDNMSGHTYLSTFAVHANTMDGSDDTPSVVTAKVKAGPLTATGKAFEASATLDAGSPSFVGNGSTGGTIDLEASGNVTLINVHAAGDFFGGSPCPNGSGACGDGGHIIVSALGVGSDVIWINGDGDVRPDDTGGSTTGGTIALNACDAINTTGTNFHGEVPTLTHLCDPAGPTLPSYAQAALNADAVIWALCNPATFTIEGTKHQDTLAGAGLPGWTIRLYAGPPPIQVGALPLFSTTTDGTGHYSFGPVGAGSYILCEVLQPGWTQTAPIAGPACIGPNEAPIGIAVTVGPDSTGNDFANTQVKCEKQPVQAVLNPTTGRFPGNKGPDKFVYLSDGAPANSIQDAIDNATDSNNDGYLLIQVLKDHTGQLGGSTNQRFTISQNYLKPFGLLGCSNTLNNPTPALPTELITSGANSPANIFVMDVHGSGSSVAGVEVDGSGREMRNVYANNNSGVGYLITGTSNLIHNGQANFNTGDGVSITGNNNTMTDTDLFGNGGDGVDVASNGNQLLKLDAGEKGKGNGGDGIHVVGSNNLISEPAAYANGGDGVDVFGATNTISKALAGDKAKGNGGDGIRIGGGANNTVTDSKANANAGNGFNVLATATGTKLKNDQSNSSFENTLKEYLFGVAITNQGGNKKDGSNFTSTAAGGYE